MEACSTAELPECILGAIRLHRSPALYGLVEGTFRALLMSAASFWRVSHSAALAEQR